MIKELHLKGVSLLLFALITSYTTEEGGCFSGSLSYMAERVGTHRGSVVRALNGLTEAGLIQKERVYKGRVPRNSYRSNYYQIISKRNIQTT